MSNYNRAFFSFVLTVLMLSLIGIVPGCKRVGNAELKQQLISAVEAGDMQRAEKQITTIIKRVKNGEESIALLEPGFKVLLKNQKFDEARQLSDFLKIKAGQTEAYLNLASSIDIQCVIGAQRWDDVPSVFSACIEQLPDADLARLMRYVFSSLNNAGQSDLLSRSAESAITAAAGKQKSVDYAAAKWVEIEIKKDKSKLPAILRKLQSSAVRIDQIGSIFIDHFYVLAGDKTAVKELCAIGTDLIKQITNESVVNEMKVKMLDGAFIVEDYDLAVSMLEAGIPGKDETWHAMSIPKVKAHRAQAQNKPLEAIKYYREFMDCWTNSDKEMEVDPQTHISYSKEWILARNSRRIAELYEAIPDKAQADKARQEAKAYFATAIEKAQDDDAALQLVQKEAAEIK